MNNSDNFQMSYTDTCGPLVTLLIHGFPLSSQMWTPQCDQLYSLSRILAPDLPGHGLSDPLPGPYTMKILAERCKDLLDSLKITEPIILGGLSMGGYVALEFYRRYPERVAGLILTATRANSDTAEGKKGRDANIQRVTQQGTEPLVDDMLPRLFAPENYENDEELVAYVHEMMLMASPEGVISALQGMRDRPDYRPTLEDIDVPTLVIHGAEDKLISVAEAEAMAAAIPNAQFHVIPNAGHLPNLEQAELFNELLADFFMIFTDEFDEEDEFEDEE